MMTTHEGRVARYLALDKDQRFLVTVIKEAGVVDVHFVCTVMRVSEDTAYAKLARLAKLGALRRIKAGRYVANVAECPCCGRGYAPTPAPGGAET